MPPLAPLPPVRRTESPTAWWRDNGGLYSLPRTPISYRIGYRRPCLYPQVAGVGARKGRFSVCLPAATCHLWTDQASGCCLSCCLSSQDGQEWGGRGRQTCTADVDSSVTGLSVQRGKEQTIETNWLGPVSFGRSVRSQCNISRIECETNEKKNNI